MVGTSSSIVKFFNIPTIIKLIISKLLKRLSILVASYDSVQDILMLWDKKFFSKKSNLNKKYNLYYGLNFKKNNILKNPSNIILYSETYDWSKSLKNWINQIESEYIFLLLDDHIIKNISIIYLDSILNNIINNNVLYAPLTYGTNILRNFVDTKRILKGRVINGKYSINLQPAIWEKNLILKLLMETTNPWDFEIISSIKYKRQKFKAYFYITKKIVFYEQYIERGKVYPDRFFEIFKKKYNLLTNRKPLGFKRRFISHLGFIYKLIKEFIIALISITIYK